MEKREVRMAGEAKDMNRNIFDIPNRLFSFLYILSFFLCAFLLCDVFFHHFPSLQRGLAAALFISLAVVVFMITDCRKRPVTPPFCRQPGFEFLGLHDLKNEASLDRRDVLSRKEEAAFMRRVLEETIFPQVSVKQALCLTGHSGCGKSTILAFFKQAYRDEYQIYDFSGNYQEFFGHMQTLFGSNIDQKLKEITYSSKAVFILDQFERYFSLPPEKQNEIRELIRQLCMEKTAVIISLREEYLSDFLLQFNMNDLLSPEGTDSAEPRGVLQELISVIEKNDRGRYSGGYYSRRGNTQVWNGTVVKNNGRIHLEIHGRQSGRIDLEQMGPTLFYCRNQNEVNAQLGGESRRNSILESKCRLLFGERGTALFKKHERESLIEQQIYFHMAEFNQKILSRPDEDLVFFTDSNNSELLKQYFDIQLASCQSAFHASRIMYLLSRARINHIIIKTEDLENALFPEMFSKKGHALYMQNMRQLESLQLIRRNTESGGLEYEIAHDFIASAFLDYCAIGMKRDIQNALDLFISEYMDEKIRAGVPRKIEYRRMAYRQRFYPVLTGCSVALMCLCYLCERFVYNPWMSVWRDMNPYGDYVPAFPLLITAASVIYLCYIYNKIVAYNHSRNRYISRGIYVVLMLLASAAVFAYPHFLFLDGVDLAIAALNMAWLLDKDHRQNSQRELVLYGVKSCMIGSVFAAGHVMFCIFNGQFADYIILTEFIMFTILVVYAFLAHMTQEFLYARMADASSEKVR